MCGTGALPSVAIVVCIASRNVPLAQQPLITTLLPSLASTIATYERRDLRAMCLYVCAQDDDDFLIERTKELRRAVGSKASFLATRLRILYFPSLQDAINKAALYAYADGATFVHHTFDDVRYTKNHWLRDAMLTLNRQGGAGVVHPAVKRTDAGHAALCRPSLVQRVRRRVSAAQPSRRAASQRSARLCCARAQRHLDVFEQHYPPQVMQLHDIGALDEWLSATYATADGRFPSTLTSGGGAHERLGGKTPLPALVECARQVLTEYAANNATARSTCVASAAVRGGGAADPAAASARQCHARRRGQVVQGYSWCALRPT
jgi:hypothetical protein